MTHTLHRRGDRESLSEDIIVFTMSAKSFNEEGSAERMRKFLDILLSHNPVNYGDMHDRKQQGQAPGRDPEQYPDDVSIVHAVFTDPAVVDRGPEGAERGRTRHLHHRLGHPRRDREVLPRSRAREATVEHSMGYFGQTKRLPGHEFMELTTMCGHGMVPANLVETGAREIKRGKKTAARRRWN